MQDTDPWKLGYSPDNVLADYSAGFFAARVGVPRLLSMLKRVGIANKVTWFIPGHSAESFPQEVQQVVESGCEVGLHGYAHEGAYSLTVQQERDIIEKCIEIATKITGKRPVGYRAPLYQVRESTLDLLEEYGFEYGKTKKRNFTSEGKQLLTSISRRLSHRPRLPSFLCSSPTSSPTHRLHQTCL
jgi:peptidoglycan/xylan/chitin deacetylase (PgdA/CDA1 family)